MSQYQERDAWGGARFMVVNINRRYVGQKLPHVGVETSV